MLGNINMDSRQIVNLLDPSLAQHAATKNYVDTNAASWMTATPNQDDK